jgi:hypothetical protein
MGFFVFMPTLTINSTIKTWLGWQLAAVLPAPIFRILKNRFQP